MQQQKELHPDQQQRQLQRLSDTRWACRHGAVSALCYTYDAVLATLSVIANGNDGVKAAEARGHLLQVQSFRFILCLVIFDRVLSCTKGLSDALQSTQLDLAKAADLVSATIEIVEEFRTDSEWEKVYSYSESVAKLRHITPEAATARPRRPPRRFDEGILYETTGAREEEQTSELYKVNLYYPVLDALLFELKRRFTNKNKDIMRALQACNPTSSTFLDPQHLEPLINTYCLDMNLVKLESPVAKRTLAKKDIQEISDVIELALLKAAFPVLVHLLQIAMTISVSSAQCERSFSTLKRIKTYLRSSMAEQRLTDLAVFSIERDISDSLNLDNVVDAFAQKHKNSRIVLT